MLLRKKKPQESPRTEDGNMELKTADAGEMLESDTVEAKNEEPGETENVEPGEAADPESVETDKEDTTESPEPDDDAAGRAEIAAAMAKAYCLGAGIDDETYRRADGLLAQIAATVNARRFSPDILQMAIHMLNYRREQAASVPHLSGTKGAGNRLSDSIFDVARGALREVRNRRR